MQNMRLLSARRLLTGAAFLSLLFLAGCEERVQVTRDHDVRIPKHATWAWRTAVEEARYTAPPAAPSGDNRPVISRDNLTAASTNPEPRTRPAPVREPNPEDEVIRERVRSAIEQTLASKGFQQVDPEQAEFLVDYKFAVRRPKQGAPAVYGGAGYENMYFREGMIVFDFIQRDTRHLVYRAVGEKPVNPEAFSLSQSDINGLTHHLLSQLNPGK